MAFIVTEMSIILLSFLFQGDNFVLSAIFCAIEENNREGLDKLLSMANIDVNQTNRCDCKLKNIFSCLSKK